MQIETLPQGISCLSNLKELMIENKGSLTINRAHRSITIIPCWSHIEMQALSLMSSYSRKLQKVVLYDIIRVNEQLCSVPNIEMDFGEITLVDLSYNEVSLSPKMN